LVHFRLNLRQAANSLFVDQSGIIQDRRGRRSPVFLTAQLEGANGTIAVKLRNLSEEGALIEGEELPGEGTIVFFIRNQLRLRCRVAWVEARYAGVAFERPLKPEQVLRQIPAPKPKVQPDLRRPGLACRPLTNYERRMLETWMTASPHLMGD
jgi:hypothetical protein